jgi:RHS repeat-associated protein
MKHLLIFVSLIIFAKESFGQTSVDYVTGTANVNVPIYELQGPTMSFPISLNYNTGGIRVNEVASAIGLGWGMNAGGSITRVIHGLADEIRVNANGDSIPGGWLQSNDMYAGYLNPTGLVPNPGIAPYRHHIQIEDMINHDSTQAHIDDINKQILDVEPDEFYINAPGLSAKFVFGIDDRKANANDALQYFIVYDENGLAMDLDMPITLPYQDLKIEYTRNLNEIISFTVTNASGYIYYFDHKESITVKNLNTAKWVENVNSTTSAWYLTKIENSNGQTEASFEYTYTKPIEPVSNVPFYKSQIRPRWPNEEGNVKNMVQIDYEESYESCPNIEPEGSDNWLYGEKVTIETITTYSGKLVFNFDETRWDVANEYALSSIQLYYNLALTGECKLSHFYFDSVDLGPTNSNLSNVVESRLGLASIQFFNASNVAIDNAISFEYSSVQLPARNCFAQDHWGYHNQQNDNTTLAPWYEFDFPQTQYLNCDREAGNSEGFNLEKITYPDGGFEKFTFENHIVSKIKTEDIAQIDMQHSTVNLLATIPFGNVNPDYFPDLAQTVTSSQNFTITHRQVVILDVSYILQEYHELATTDCFSGPRHLTVQIMQGNNLITKISSHMQPFEGGPLWDPINIESGTENFGRECILEPGEYTFSVILEVICKTHRTIEINALLHYYTDNDMPDIKTRVVGGLRLKSIIISDGDQDTSNDMVRRFEYKRLDDSSLSSGVLMDKVNYKYDFYNSITMCMKHSFNALPYDQLLNDPSVEWYWQVFDCSYFNVSSESINPQQRPKGSHVLYSNIYEYIDNIGQASGYTRYDFSINSFPIGSEALAGGMQNMKEWQNVAIRKISYFDSNNNLLKYTIYTYDEKDPIYVNAINRNYKGVDGLIRFLGVGIDHEILKEAAKKIAIGLVIDAAMAAAGVATGGTVSTLSIISMVVDVASLLYVGYLALSNPDLSIEIDHNSVHTTFELLPYSYSTEKFNLINIKEVRIDRTNPSRIQEKLTRFEYNTGVNTTESNPQNTEAYSNTRMVGMVAQSHDDVDVLSSHALSSADYHMIASNSESTDPMVKALWAMMQRNVHNTVIETIETSRTNEDGPWAQEMVTGGKLTTYKLDASGNLVADAIYKLELPEPIVYSASMLSKIQNNAFVMHSAYRKIGTIVSHDQYLKPNLYQPENDIAKCAMRDYFDGRIVATITNATPSQCNYSSFETDNLGGWTYNLSGIVEEQLIWPNGVNVTAGATGAKYYKLNSPVTGSIGNGNYVITYWTKGGNASISNTSLIFGEEFSENIGANGWVFHKVNISNTTNNIISFQISGNATIFIDELRLYPQGALFNSIAYNADGNIHTVCDVNNNTSYYIYDELNRPQIMLDQDFNIVNSLQTFNQSTNDGGDYTRMVLRSMLDEGESKSDALSSNLIQNDQLVTQIFYDGLSRPVQMHGIKQSPTNATYYINGKYDQYGLSPRTWMPFAKAGYNGNFNSDFDTDQADFYSNTNHVAQSSVPFADLVFDNTPFKHVIESGAPGEEWQVSTDNTMKRAISLNAANEVLQWYPFAHGNGAEAKIGNANQYWPKGSLTKVETEDENGKKVWNYYSQLGRLILKRTRVYSYSDGNDLPFTTDLTHGKTTTELAPEGGAYRNVDTYFVYDLKGNLIYEIPYAMLFKLGQSAAGYEFKELDGETNNAIFNGLGYGWHFDYKERLIEKKSPDTKWVFYIYNVLNQPVMSQDERQRITDQWSFVRYDVYGRVAYSGVLTKPGSRQSIQNAWNTYTTNLWESRGNAVHGYTNLCAMGEYDHIYSINYFDNHNFPHAGQEFDGTEVLTHRLMGYPTGNKTLILDQPTDEYLSNTIYYDFRGRPVQLHDENMLGGYDKFDYTYDWLGNMLMASRRHLLQEGANPWQILNEYEYDRTGRLVQVEQQTGNDPPVVIAKLIYNELGQLVKKHLHIPTGQDAGMQVLDYRYNIRGWLRKINNSNLVDDGDNLEDYDVFGIELMYNDADLQENTGNKYSAADALKPQAQHNGMLSAIKWNSKLNPDDDGTFNSEKTYVYRYDDMYRMTGGYFASENLNFGNADYGQFNDRQHYYTEKANYDLAGNIKMLQRYRPSQDWSQAIIMDDLRFTYNENSYQLKSVEDIAIDEPEAGKTQFVNNAMLSQEYVYDVMGNLVEDKNKELSFVYNTLGLVSTINHTDHPGQPVTFVYDAAGRKLKKTTNTQTTYYINGAEYYVNTSNEIKLRHIANSTGIVRPKQSNENNTTEYIYDYYIKDHQGNLRAVITEGNATDDVDIATMEWNMAAQEDVLFERVPDTRSPLPPYYPNGVNNNTKVASLGSGSGAASTQGPARLLAVGAATQLQTSTTSWYNGQNIAPTTGQSLAQITASLLAGIVTQGAGVMPPGEAGVGAFANPASAPSLSVAQFLADQLQGYDPNDPKAYLMYLAFDQKMNLLPDQSGAVPVTDPNELELLEASITMPESGYFYTFLTNYSVTTVHFDNYQIRHKQGVVRAKYDYYPYGLMWSNPTVPAEGEALHDNTLQDQEWQQNEWADASVDMYMYPLRMYDAVLGRFHAPDPYEQFHSPYMAVHNNPANFIDPTGGSSYFWCDLGEMLGGKVMGVIGLVATVAVDAKVIAGIFPANEASVLNAFESMAQAQGDPKPQIWRRAERFQRKHGGTIHAGKDGTPTVVIVREGLDDYEINGFPSRKTDKLFDRARQFISNTIESIKEASKHVYFFAGGLSNAWLTNHTFGFGRLNPTDAGKYEKAFQAGQTTGDILSIITGIAEVAVGVGGGAASLILDATGIGAVVGVPVGAAAVAIAADGTVSVSTAIFDLGNDALNPKHDMGEGSGGGGGNYKRLSKNKDANDYAKKMGYKDAHDMKDAHLGPKNQSRWDIEVDQKTGQGRFYLKEDPSVTIDISPNY